MLKLAKYHISRTHGFCIDYEPVQYLSGLSKHIEVLKNMPNFTPDIVHTLPKFTDFNKLSYSKLEFAFLVHLMLNSAYYWNSNTPCTDIPENLAVPTLKLSKILNRPPIINLASVQYHNWKVIDKKRGFHPDNLECIFSFSGTKDESNFYHCANYIEYLGAPAVLNILRLQQIKSDISGIESVLKNIRESIRNMRGGFELLMSRVDPDIFYNTFRKKLRSFEKGVNFGHEFSIKQPLLGASASQSPLLKLIDAGLGISHNCQYLNSTEMYLKKPHQDLLNHVRNNFDPNLKSTIMESAEAVDEWNAMIMELYNFRKDHIELTKKFILKPSGLKETTGTGGSSLTSFLNNICENTRLQCIDINLLTNI